MFKKFKIVISLTLCFSLLFTTICFATNNDIIVNSKPVGSTLKPNVLNSNVISTVDVINNQNSGPGLMGSSDIVISDSVPQENLVPSVGFSDPAAQISQSSAVLNALNQINAQNNALATTQNTSLNNNGPITYTKIQANEIKNITQPKVSCDSCILVNANTNEIYFAKNEDKQLHPASLPQVLACYLLLRDHKQDELISISSDDYASLEKDASILQLYNGDMISVKNAVLALMLKSACDIANSVSRFISGNLGQFITLMNDTLKQIGCTNTNVANITGLNNDQHKSCAADMAKMFQYCIRNSELVDLMKTQKHVFPAGKRRDALTVYNPMQLISKTSTNYYEGVVCGKQGFNSKALYNIASVLEYKDQKLIAVVLKANASHYYDTKKLYDFAKTVVDQKIQDGTLNQLPTSQGINNTTSAATINSQAQANAAVAAMINNQNNAASANSSNATSNAVVAGAESEGWHQDSYGWYYINSQGVKMTNAWVTSNNKRYCVDQNGYMVTGFRDSSNGERYYFDEVNGELKMNTWVNTTLGAYYLDEAGRVQRANPGTTKEISTPVGKYVIDENGKALSKVQ